ncbi:MAG: bifunctional phosphoribosyl-AMP cyclohydrolase/phosphoribosyl-ATP diphosphatase HisIE [Gaiella sp.]
MADPDLIRGPRRPGHHRGQALVPAPERLLTPVIVQDVATDRVLMLAYADEEAIRRTRETGEAWFWSRSRQELWHKGATSGNTMAVEEIRDDCDGDALLYRVSPNGPACHTGAESCFTPWLWRVVAERAAARPEGSYVAALLERGARAAAQKVGEEGLEAALAGAGESDERLVEELADLWFHSYVLLAARGLDPTRVEDVLRARHSAEPPG